MSAKFKTLSTLGDRALIAAAPELWNVLPLNLGSISDFNVFKSHRQKKPNKF